LALCRLESAADHLTAAHLLASHSVIPDLPQSEDSLVLLEHASTVFLSDQIRDAIKQGLPFRIGQADVVRIGTEKLDVLLCAVLHRPGIRARNRFFKQL
jgi:hypothetical protein